MRSKGPGRILICEHHHVHHQGPNVGCEFAEKKKDMLMIISTHANSKRKRGAYRVRGGWGHHYRSSYVLLFVWLLLSLLRLQPESPRPTYMPRVSTLDQVTPAQASSSSWTSATRRSAPACKATRPLIRWQLHNKPALNWLQEIQRLREGGRSGSKRGTCCRISGAGRTHEGGPTRRRKCTKGRADPETISRPASTHVALGFPLDP